ncbi:MAG: hypothetical protein HRU08_11410 [Oleispira sp.]|nr:hypothetical protein [Oleispira sp.]
MIETLNAINNNDLTLSDELSQRLRQLINRPQTTERELMEARKAMPHWFESQGD